MQNDFNYETPAHLEIPEYQTVDYDKTRQMTIEQLQNQLIAAQNHIEAIENEKTSNNNSDETANDVSAEVVSISEKSSNHNIVSAISLSIIFGLVIFVFVLGLKAFISENDIEINIPNISEQQIVDYELTPIPEIGSIPIYSSDEGMSLYLNRKEQEQPQERQETEQEQSEIDVFQNCINFALRFLPIILTVLGLKFGIGFLMNVLRGS
ncbi:MAG: hypothetical protein K2G04_01245 [Oscillospiraceae bacterium]|nr:hypothetical protein [Oscillospiraceae bacterium]